MRLRRLIAVVGSAAIVATSAVACSENTGTGSGSEEKAREAATRLIGTAEDSKGPAAEVKGANKGGKLTLLKETWYENLDPQNTYYVVSMAIEALYSRQLTTYRQNADGSVTIVGDLATDPGKDVKGDCTTWEYKLKDNLKYEDGTPITAADVAYGVGRSYAENLADGPLFIQGWLSGEEPYNKSYKGPYNGGAKVPPGVEVKDDKTIVFNFKKAHCDTPFAMAMGTSTPLPAAKDTGVEYQKKPFSSGPYKVKEIVWETKLVLERNPNWDPATDPVRHQYLDEFHVEVGQSPQQISQRLLANNGPDQMAMTDVDVPVEVLPQVIGNQEALKRTIEAPDIFVYYLGINNEKVKDLKVRQALNYALDKEGYLKVLGGEKAGTPATTILSPAVQGQQKFDLFGGAKGDKEKAKELLGGKAVKLKYAYRNDASGQKTAAYLQADLAKAGITLELVPLDKASAGKQLGRKDHGFDLYAKNWGMDWPLGSTVIPPIFDGRTITSEGNVNNIFFNQDSINKEIDRISAMPADDQGPEWGTLDKKIMEEFAPLVPIYYGKSFALYGSKVGGLYQMASIGTIAFTDLHVKA